MKKLKLASMTAVTLAAFSLATASFALVTDPEPEPEPAVKGNNGLGNGDQPAPGGSGAHNKAENQAGAPGHASGKAQVPN